MRVDPKDSVRKIAILFHDNDFYYSFTGVLKALYAVWEFTEYLPKDKEKLAFMINNLSAPMYVIAQNRWEYNGLEDVKTEETLESDEYIHIKKWLTIKPENILIDDEVDEMNRVGETDNRYFFNGEYFVLDTTLFNNNIYSR